MTLKNTILFWIGAALAVVLFLFAFSSILLPFVAGMGLAYLLDPIADRLERMGLSRTLSATVILLLFLAVLVLAILIIAPVLGSQLAEFAARVPGYVDMLQALVTRYAGSQIAATLGISPEALKGSLGQMASDAASLAGTLLQSIVSGGQAFVSMMALMVVTPVVAFYMLLDWDRMVDWIDQLLPREHVDTIRELAREMDQGVANFVRGQVSVSTLLGLFYAIGLSLVGLNFGLLIGMFAGLISFIPYIGSVVGGVLALGVALVQFWPDWTMVAIVAAIFGIGQFVEGNILQPKLVGRSVGIHPVWLMFALFAFAALFGFLGMLIAVPASTAIAVLIRFAVRKYVESPLYRGRGPELVAEEQAVLLERSTKP